MSIQVILAITGIFLSIAIPIISYLLKSRREARQYYAVVWKKSSRLKEKDLLGERPFNVFYFERNEDARLKRCLQRRTNFLLVGPPLTGKTRAVYEHLKKMHKKADVLVPRSVSLPSFIFPKDRTFWRKKIIFIDDLQNYVEKQSNYHMLLRHAKDANAMIAATCLSGQEYKKVRNKLIEQNIDIDVLFGDNIIEYERVSPETAKQIALKLNLNWDQTRFNGTIGSIFMRLSEMDRRYQAMNVIEKTILQVLRMMNITGLYSDNGNYDLSYLKTTAAKMELTGKDFEWNGWLRALCEKEFVQVIGKSKVWAEEAYLRSIVKPNADIKDFDVFDEMIEIFAHEPRALMMIGTRAYDYGSVDIDVADYMKAVIRAFDLVLSKSDLNTEQQTLNAYQNVGLAHWRLASYEDAVANNMKSLEYYKKAITVIKKDEQPFEFAKLQNMLGNSYSALASIQDTETNANEAIKLFKESLVYYTPQRNSKKYAQACINLGAVYLILGQVADPAANFKNAVKYLNQALNVIEPEKDPKMYADALNNLGNTYNMLANTESKAENLKYAMECFTSFSKIYNKDSNPLGYSLAMTNLGSIHCNLATIENTDANCTQAFKYLNEALQIRTPDKFPVQFAYVQYWLGQSYLAMASFKKSKEYCYKSLEAFTQSLSIKTRDSHPFHYAFSIEGLADAYILLAELNEDRPENYRKSLAAYDEALSVFSEDKTPALYSQIQEKISRAKKVFF